MIVPTPPPSPGVYDCLFSVAPFLVTLWWDGAAWRYGVARVHTRDLIGWQDAGLPARHL